MADRARSSTRKNLTAAAVKAIRPDPKRRLEIPDASARGLYLVVQSSGAKSWAMRFRRPNGTPAKFTLGPVDLSGREAGEPRVGAPLSLAAARVLAADVQRQRALDRDVIADHSAEQRRRKAQLLERNSNTFGDAAVKFIEGHKVKKSGQRPRRWRETASLLGVELPDNGEASQIEGGLAARWKDKAITEIDGHDIYAVVDEARRLGIPGLGRRNHDVSDARGRKMADALSTMFGWLLKHRRVSVDPCTGMFRPAAPAARNRVLNSNANHRRADELRWFWSACEATDGPFGALLKVLLLTGCRLTEITRMPPEELNDDQSSFYLPSERTKNGLPHVVPLAPLARDILRGELARWPSARFVISTNGVTPVSGLSKMKRRFDKTMLSYASREHGEEYKLMPWRIHDLRRTAATGMAGIGIAPHIVEATLNHVSGYRAGVAGTYNREQYEPEKRVALERWAAHVQGIVTARPTNVTQLSRKR